VGFASVRRRRSPPPKFKRNSDYEDFYSLYLPDPFDGGYTSDMTFENSKGSTYPFAFSGHSTPPPEGSASSFIKASDVLIGSNPNGDALSNSAPHKSDNYNPATHVALVKLERTPGDNKNGSTNHTDSPRAAQGETAEKAEKEKAREKALLREDMQSRWFQSRIMDEESYMKISKLHEVVILPKLRKYSTVDGLHGPTGLGFGAQENGLSYGKYLPTPRKKSSIALRLAAPRISPSAAMVSPLYDILAELGEQIERESAESDEERSLHHPFCVPAVRGHRSSHRRMAAHFDA
ncbi:hypothetical protein FRC03_007321, partial [Tulasnella sp. 419]